jgi:peptidoglycan/LPS O-acetylase OafA/YrhL
MIREHKMLRLWVQATALAQETRVERNRYIDFIRALSILVVMTGHWLMSSFHYENGELTAGAILEMQPGIQPLTWIFQVMPMFFIVGGYSNAASLQGYRRRGADYANWLASRLRRLVPPLLLLVSAWGILAFVLHVAGVSGQLLQLASRAALIPTWFLAIYIIVVVLSPATYALWQHWGFRSFWLFGAMSVVVDLTFFAADLRWTGWINYLWVWLAVHQLGYVWRDGVRVSVLRQLTYSALAFLTLILLVRLGPYPLAMVGSPDEDVSNSMPPKVTLLALGILQYGVLRALEPVAQRWLASSRIWAATVLINSTIMTLYLWHLTVMVILVALAYVAGGFGLRSEPLTIEWLWTRPAWIATLIAMVVFIMFLFSGLERRQSATDTVTPAATRQIGGSVLICTGVALLARFGFGNAPVPGIDIAAFVMVVSGSALSGLLPIIFSRPGV